MGKKSKKKMSITKYERITLIISLVSIVVAILSFMNSQNSYKLAQTQYYESTVPIWKIESVDDEVSIAFNSNNPDIEMQNGKIFFPTELQDGNRTLLPPDYKISHLVLDGEVENLLADKLIRPENAYLYVEDFMIPVVIDSNYIVKGVARRDVSVYYLTYTILWNTSDLNSSPELSIKGMYFDSRIDISKVDYQKTLDSIWKLIVDDLVDKSKQ